MTLEPANGRKRVLEDINRELIMIRQTKSTATITVHCGVKDYQLELNIRRPKVDVMTGTLTEPGSS